MRRILIPLLLLAAVVSCDNNFSWDFDDTKQEIPEDPQPQDDPQKEDEKDKPVEDKYGISYVYDESVVPELHLEFPLAQWNELLTAYDADKNTKKQVHCDAMYIKDKDTTRISDSGFRLRGAATRRRPEGSAGNMHMTPGTDWNRVHFQINFRKFVKDDEHTVHGARKIMLRANTNDPSYIREKYCYDLFRRAGVFAGVNSAHCKLFIHVAGDAAETYYGVYTMVEAIDDEFLKYRKDEFGSSKGNLWKCRHKATLTPDSNFSNIGEDNDEGIEYIYELKTNIGELDQAKAQLTDFVTKFNTLEGTEFHDWIATVCDVPMLLRTYAVNVAVGMWDDYWNNMNNYYIYFNSKDPENYKFYFIPFDYDNSLGNCSTRNDNEDQGRHNVFEWGPKTRPLIWKIIQYEDYRTVYARELLRLVDPKNDLMYYPYSISRVNDWQARIKQFIINDTGEGNTMQDRPTSGSTHKEYRLATDCNDNFFKVKESSIHLYCDPYQ